MQDNACSLFFKQHSEDKDIVKKLQEFEDRFEWEHFSASSLSPGVVNNDEQLCRHIFNPLHIDVPTNSLKPTAFDDVSSIGLSVDRLLYRTIEESISHGHSRADAHNQARPDAPTRSLHAYAIIFSTVIRAIVHEGTQGLGIYDTACEENHAHADVCLLVSGKQASRSIRSKLVDIAANALNPV